MWRHSQLQDDDRDDVNKHRDEYNDEHCGAVELNAGEIDGVNDIEGANIEEADEIEEK